MCYIVSFDVTFGNTIQLLISIDISNWSVSCLSLSVMISFMICHDLFHELYPCCLMFSHSFMVTMNAFSDWKLRMNAVVSFQRLKFVRRNKDLKMLKNKKHVDNVFVWWANPKMDSYTYWNMHFKAVSCNIDTETKN